MHSKDLMDKDVFAIDGWKIGKTKDIVCEQTNWKVTFLDTEHNGSIEDELGMGNAPLAHNRLPIAVSEIQGVGDVITLKTTRSQTVADLAAKAAQIKAQLANQHSDTPIVI